MYSLYASVPNSRRRGSRPALPRGFCHANAASTSVPPPISSVPGALPAHAAAGARSTTSQHGTRRRCSSEVVGRRDERARAARG